MSTAAEIRPAVKRDAAKIVSFNAALAAETEARTLDNAILTRGVERVLSDPNLGQYFVAEKDGEIVAQLMLTYEWSDWRCGMFWWIQSVYVDPNHRRQGLFRRLIEHVRSEAAAASGVCGIRLYVEVENGDAIATYTQMGLEPTTYQVMEDDWNRPPSISSDTSPSA